MTHDDLGTPVQTTRPARRVVSLVPSLTETIARARPEAVVGATDWCTHPPDLETTRVRGTKNPDLAAIRALEPDLVIANQEENRKLDVERLRGSGVTVWVTRIETVDEALHSISRLFEAGLGWPAPDWLDEAIGLWSGEPPETTYGVAVPVWRDPWMVAGPRTFSGDLLRKVGLHNVFDKGTDRYPKATAAAIDQAGAELVLLPDEPYVFTAQDGPEAFLRTPTELVNGRMLMWYGPSLLEAHRVLSAIHARLAGI